MKTSPAHETTAIAEIRGLHNLAKLKAKAKLK
jgi:hypothetical protein